MKLDIDFVRSQFDQLHDEPEFTFASNAGGSYVCNQVNKVLEHYNHHTRVQPYSRFSPSAEAGEAMDRAHDGWAQALKHRPLRVDHRTFYFDEHLCHGTGDRRVMETR